MVWTVCIVCVIYIQTNIYPIVYRVIGNRSKWAIINRVLSPQVRRWVAKINHNSEFKSLVIQWVDKRVWNRNSLRKD